ncbi:LIC12162 family transferase [Massilia sp. TWP1-3-3]|uniref:LIC12162 family transferase n=1 Tax=Massilia sp. TWP1-3-3 TaxID=2804573 RepID=UPI003CEC9E62
MPDTGGSDVFLATTALEAFWDTGRPMVFLGPWCLADQRTALAARRTGLLVSPFAQAHEAEAAYEHVNGLYEDILPRLADALNRLHGEQHPVRYWRIVVGPWLHIYLSVLYDRFRHLEAALAAYPALTTIGLAREAYVTPADTQDFAAFLLEDAYNLQLYTALLAAMGRRFPVAGADMRQAAGYVKGQPGSWKQRAMRWVARRYVAVAAASGATVLMKDAYFPKKVLLALCLRRFGRILPSLGAAAAPALAGGQQALRAALSGVALGESAFARCVAAMLPTDLPTCFVEGYGAIGAAAAAHYPRRIKAICSANGWYYDEIFKRWAAASALRGTALLGIQHGGNYGALAMMPSEEHEIAITDRYYTWGWQRTGCAAMVAPMPAPKLIGRAARSACPGGGILWVATIAPRYLVQFPWVPGDFATYLDWQQRFAGALDAATFARLRLRPHREDNQWQLVDRLAASFPQLPVEGWDVSFEQSMRQCELYVCDHLSTTFIEALAANTPTILFWETRSNKLRQEAVPYYALLREAGILFDDPAAAAAAVNAVMATGAEIWWAAPERQRAVAAFCARFACTDAHALDAWDAELARQLAAPAVAAT